VNDLITPLNTDPALTILLTVAGVVLAVFFALGHWAGRRSGRAESVTAALTEAEVRRVATAESATRAHPVQSTRQEMAERVATGEFSPPAVDAAGPQVFQPMPTPVSAPLAPDLGNRSPSVWPLPAPPVRPSVEQQVIRTPAPVLSLPDSGRHHQPSPGHDGVERTTALPSYRPRLVKETSS